ncbi:hypothetical protein MYP_4300 [Sporocytophaga myxococcoides]|uniref:Lipoprotein n=1 Tax=Sporocytophaga myxococcoides TaxID=153721 RepID=A0A098LJD7_9BACT|nr:hypothetical protein [Sporocytophaga myxococcoides]GAL87070.1 hypothetical protein MYP_4300 [Sporocytophaga myxococcoides]
MNKIVIVIAILVAVACSNIKETNENVVHQNVKSEEGKRSDTLLVEEVIIIDTLNAMAIVHELLQSSAWFYNERELWILNWQSKGDTMKSIVLNKALSSDLFSNDMYKTICLNAEKKENIENLALHFGNYFHSTKLLGRLLKSFCKKDTNEIIKNLEIKGDSARYTTEFYNVLNEAPYNVDGFEWMSEVGEQGEKWLFAVHLVKEDGEWKIDKVDKHFGLYKE